MPRGNPSHYFFDEGDHVIVVPIKLVLHGIFWFHTSAQSRGKYVHIAVPVIHNYPLILAFLGRPVEASYANVTGRIEPSIRPEDVWEKEGFYVYPAVAGKILSKNLLFSMGGTGYAVVKLQTRAPVPDLAVNQVYLPGSEFKTYIVARNYRFIPNTPFIRVGAKRYGVFRVEYGRPRRAKVAPSGVEAVTHPFNERDTNALEARSILRHYMGNIAIYGAVEQVIRFDEEVLAAPKFI